MRLSYLSRTALALAVSAFALCAGDAKAEDAGTTISATVQNAFTFVENTALNFGTFVAIADASDTSNIIVAPGGANTVNNPGAALIIALSAGVPGSFTVSGAAPSTALTISLPTSVTLVCGACSGSQPDFVVNTFVDSGGGTVTTNGSGGVSFTVGATMNTETSATPYEDGTYSAAYTVSANY